MNSEPIATLIESRTVHRGRVFTVEIDRVELPNGREVDVDVVRHAPSAIIVPMPDPSHVILIRQYRHAVGRWLWEVPAGSVAPGESPEQAAVRECHEEIGLLPVRVTPLGTFLPTPGYCDEQMLIFRADGLREPAEVAEPDADELILPRTFTLEEARAMVLRGEIPDLKSAVALMLVR